MKRLVMEFVGVTESAALAAHQWIGKGNKNEADAACTETMRERLNEIEIDAEVVIGEGELDEAPMLYIGEKVGTGKGPKLDIAVDPLDGTTLIAKGQGDSLAVIAGAPKGSLLHAPDMYMDKIAVGPKAAGKIDLDFSLYENMKIVAEANQKDITELNIAVQDRERHQHIIDEVQRVGASVTLFGDVDITPSISTALTSSNIDMFLGVGGAPEGVITAVALRSLGGDMQGRLVTNDDQEFDRCVKMGLTNPRQKLTMEDLVSSDDCFFVATGITDGALLDGVSSNKSGEMVTHSLLVFGGRLHFIKSVHLAQDVLG